MSLIDRLYDRAATQGSDFRGHVRTLRMLARMVRTCGELGTRKGVSTAALIAGCDDVWTVDLFRQPEVAELELAAQTAGVRFRFVEHDTLTLQVPNAVDLLMVDSLHTAAQVRGELERHGWNVNRFLVFHDVISFGARGEDGGPGIWPVINDYCGRHGWRLLEFFEHDNGLAIWDRGR